VSATATASEGPHRGALEKTTATRVLAAFLAARALFGVVYLGVSLGRWPVPWYYPIEHRWAFEPAPSGLAMGWFGATAAALAAAIAAGAIAWLASARGPFARLCARRGAVPAMARAVGLMMLVDFAYFGWTLTHQTPAPWPIPPGCTP